MWRQLALLALLSGTRCLATAAPTRLSDLGEALGSPGELAWEAWLLTDRPPAPAAEGGADVEVGAPRHRASRNIFISQTLRTSTHKPCPSGYLNDKKGGCHEVIHTISVSTRPLRIANISDVVVQEGSGESAVANSGLNESLRRYMENYKRHTLSSRRDVDNVRFVTKEKIGNNVDDSVRNDRRIKIISTSSEEYRHKIPIIGGEEDQEIPFNQVRVRGID